jgi:CspA family cold shock protein
MTKQQRHSGRIKFFKRGSGFGFIRDDDGSDLFFHISSVEPGHPLIANFHVTFEVGVGRDGRAAAQNIRVVD